jgi:hypothetical protein
VQELPDEWLEGAQAITTRVEKARKAQGVIDQKLALWRNNHPAYKHRI